MEQSVSDLLSDALSETSVPSFLDRDFDFGDFNFDEKFEEDDTGASDEDGARHQEGTGETPLLSHRETKDIHKSDSVEKEQSDDDDNNEEEEDSQGVGVGLMSMDRAAEEDYTSSDGEGSASGEDENMSTGEKTDLLMSVCSSDEFCDGNKEDRIFFAEGQPLAPESAENPQVRNEEPGESESDEEDVSYFRRVPERDGDGTEEDEQKSEGDEKEDLSDSVCENMKVEQEERDFARCLEQEVERPFEGEPATACLEFPVISEQNLQVLVAEVDGEEHVEKMKDFSEEEHQEAGESFADYPSDFSSCEFVEDGVKGQGSKSLSGASPRASDSCSSAEQNACLDAAGTDLTWMGTEEEEEGEQGDGFLTEAVEFRSFEETAGEKDKGKTDIVEEMLGEESDDESETDDSDSYSSSDDDKEDDDEDDDEFQEGGREEELLTHMRPQDLESDPEQEDMLLYGASCAAFSRWSNSDDRRVTDNRVEPSDFRVNWDFNVSNAASILSEDLLTTHNTDGVETRLSDVSQRPAEDVSGGSAVQREDGDNSRSSSLTYQGSLDDGFFFNTELQASTVTEPGPPGDDSYEEERSWEQEQERIKAFYKFYNDSEGEDEREERQIKVQFCADPLSQVIHYETDSSDRDSFSSSTDGEEDLSSETYEEPREPDDTMQTIPALDPLETRAPSEPEENLGDAQMCGRKHRGLCVLKLILKMGLVIAMGLLVFWLATDQPDWLSQAPFF